MTFYLYDFSEYFGTVELDSEDYETAFSADVDDCYDYESEAWNDEAIRASAEAQVKARFGADAVIIWEGRI